MTQVACSTPARMSVNDLSTYKIDCSHRQEQYEFLESQRYSNNDRFMLGIQMTSITGILSNMFRGTEKDSRSGMNGEHEAMITVQQQQLRQRCLLEDHVNRTNERTRKFVEERERSLR
jgi:hypothetical protein